MGAFRRWERNTPFIDSVCSYLPSLDSELCVGGQKTKVTQVQTLVLPGRLEDKPSSLENSERTVIRAINRGQKARGSLKKRNSIPGCLH